MAVTLDAKYRKDPKRALGGALAFEGLPEGGLDEVLAACRWVYMRPGERLSRVVERAPHSCHYFVADGQIGAARSLPRSDDGLVRLKLADGKSDVARRYVALFEVGDGFSDAYLDLRPDREAIDCVATMETMLASIPEPALEGIMDRYPGWRAAVIERNAEARARYLASRSASVQVVQDFYVHQNYSIASTLKVIDLEACIGCDGCERACADRHGVPRLMRQGPILGRLSFPISCRTCVDHRCLPACGFDALTMSDEHELRIDKMKCVGCRACYEACPNSVITMIETPYTADDFPNAMPNTDLEGRTNVPGLYLVGEASGAALIKVASNGGVAAAKSIIADLAPHTGPAGVHDVLIVGAGPAGLAASLQCLDAGMDFVVFDKGDFAKTIHSYPREKVVMAEPAHIPKYGMLWLQNTTKEGLIEKWREVIANTGLKINGHESVQSVKKGDDGLFDVVTEKAAYRAHRVILATGNRGTPRRLGVANEKEPRVEYTLTDPELYQGKRVLVVGGGDSAVEAAMSLADFGADATLSYRRDSFGRIKGGNRTRLAEYEEEGKVRVILESTVTALDDGGVTLKTKGGPVEIGNDFVFALLGAEPPIPFFEAAGIEILQPKSPEMQALAETRGTRFYANKCDHCAGYDDQACIQACPTGAILELPPDDVFLERDPISGAPTFKTEPFVEGLDDRVGSPVLRRIAAAAGVLAIVVTVLIGLECFARSVMPDQSATAFLYRALGITEEVTFSAGHGFGFWLGIIGMSCMAVTALYPLNSRLGWARRWAKTKFWLAAHVMAGLIGPAFVSYHTMLKLNRWPSLAFWAMWAVVFSGVVGRYAYSALRGRRGRSLLESESLTEQRRKLAEQVSSGRGRTEFLRVDEIMAAEKQRRTHALFAPFYVVATSVFRWLRFWKHRLVDLRHIADRELRARAIDNLREAGRAQQTAMLLETVERSATLWRRIHFTLTGAMFTVATAHVVVALLYRSGAP